MNLVVKVTGERVKTTLHTSWSNQSNQNPQTEPYTVADVTLDGTPDLVARTLRALAETISPEVSR